MPAKNARPARQATASRLLLVGAGLWGAAPFYALAVRPAVGSRLPPRESWGSAETETDQLNSLVAGVSALMILAAAAAVVWVWAYTAIRLRRGSRHALEFAPVMAFGTALLAVAGTGGIFHTLLSAPALGVLVPLLSVSLAGIVATLMTRPQDLVAGLGSSSDVPVASASPRS